MPKQKRNVQTSKQQEPKLPPGVKLLRTLEGHRGIVESMAFNPTGRSWLAGAMTTVKLWDVASGKLLRTLEGHKDIIWSVAFDPGGQMLASESSDNTVKLWDVATGKPAAHPHRARIHCL